MPASTKALAIPEILCLIFDCMTLSALRQASLVCKEWERLANRILANQLVIPNDWYAHDLSHLWPYLDRRGEHVKALALELSPSARLAQEVDLEHMTRQLDNILSRTPNLERLDVQVPREVKSSILTTVVGRHGKKLQQFETSQLNWEPSDMAHLLEGCSQLRHLSGHNFSGDLLQTIVKSQPLLSMIDCTHPRFDDDELIAFAKQVPNLLRLSVSQHQFLSTKALIGIANYCFQLEYLNLHFCLSLQSNGFQALLAVSPNLRFLDLGLTEVHDADIVVVANRCPQLESLKLPFCGNLTQTGIRAIVHSCSRLLHLDLSFCDKIMLTIFGNPSSPSSSSSFSSSTPSTSQSLPYSPWGCLGLQSLDISGIHASYSADTSVASALLPAMYHQIGLLTDLRTLKLSGHGFSLQLLEQGRIGLSKLTRLERLDVAKLRNPLPWATIIEIGNLFPKLTELQFRSNDVIPPQAAVEQEQAISEVEAKVGHRIKRGRFVDQQPEPIHQEDNDDRSHGGSMSLPIVVPNGMKWSALASTSTFSTTGASPTPSEPSLSKRKRSRSSSPTPNAPSTATDDINTTADERSSVQDKKDTSFAMVAAETGPADEQTQLEVMSATLRSGLKISFRLNGEDDDDLQGGPGDFGAGGVIGWGFPEAMPF
ncbi:F-box and leucine-rich repeat protein 4 [Linnemannia gamsii]|uniref:F-box and leucine-rich repeat protein 4 n=1 Tax=Linnemannia gamsii TaxID=64522 RepID=A0ABQ7JIT7_9FUNG|nr:F-box and leucine-rich repeat protein 4 [Linnemannia gamsii]